MMASISAPGPQRGCPWFIPFVAFGWLLASLAAAPGAARAADEVFTVANVAVDATAATAAAARERALQEGQRRAFARLLQRLTPPASRSGLQLADAAISDLVRDFEIAGEKTSPVRYIATLTVRFKPADVRSLLRRRGIAFSETPSKPILVLPVYDGGNGAVLFADSPWQAAWAGRVPGDGLVPFVLPRGDADDAAVVTPEQAVAGDDAGLRAIAARYGVSDVLVAVARARPDEASGHDRLDVSASRFGTAAGDESIVAAIAPEASDADPGVVFDRAAAEIMGRIEEEWKQSSLLHFDSQRQIEVAVPLGSLDRLVTVMRGLDGLASIQKVDIVRIARDEADLRLVFVGDEDQLALLLAQRDLALDRGAGAYVLRSTAGGATR